jgi:hypothetical protein
VGRGGVVLPRRGPGGRSRLRWLRIHELRVHELRLQWLRGWWLLRAGKRAGRQGSRRGPGQPGSARRVADASCGPAGAFATGHLLDVAPGGAALLGLAEYAAGDGDRFAGANEDELMGVICALDRCEASASALKHAAVAELIRRRPRPQDEPVLSEAGDWEEFTATELSYALARPAGDPPVTATSSTTSLMKRVEGPAYAMGVLCAGTTIGSSSTRAGRWSRLPRPPSDGRPRRAGRT